MDRLKKVKPYKRIKNEYIGYQFLGERKYQENKYVFYGYREYKNKLQTFCV